MAPTTHETIYFYGVGNANGFLSQHASTPFILGGIEWPTAEHCMMWKKAMLFGDEVCAAEILKSQKPADAKKLGRKVKPFKENVWEAEGRRIVTEVSMAKFKGAYSLKEKLLATGDAYLVEASPKDKKWGIGYGMKEAEANRETWGANLLGGILMDVRTQLREDENRVRGLYDHMGRNDGKILNLTAAIGEMKVEDDDDRMFAVKDIIIPCVSALKALQSACTESEGTKEKRAAALKMLQRAVDTMAEMTECANGETADEDSSSMEGGVRFCCLALRNVETCNAEDQPFAFNHALVLIDRLLKM